MPMKSLKLDQWREMVEKSSGKQDMCTHDELIIAIVRKMPYPDSIFVTIIREFTELRIANSGNKYPAKLSKAALQVWGILYC